MKAFGGMQLHVMQIYGKFLFLDILAKNTAKYPYKYLSKFHHARLLTRFTFRVMALTKTTTRLMQWKTVNHLRRFNNFVGVVLVR